MKVHRFKSCQGNKKYKMKKDTKEQLAKENKSYLELNPVAQRTKAQEVLIKAKELEAKKLAAGKKWVRIDKKTEVLK